MLGKIMMKKEYICDLIIFGIASLELLKISYAYHIYGALLMVFCFGWVFMVGVPVGIVMAIMGYIPYQFDHAGYSLYSLLYLCMDFNSCNSEVFKRDAFCKKAVIHYIIPQLIMGVAIAIYPPFH